MTENTPKAAPSTRRIKSRAKAIRKETGVAHHEALDVSAREAGFKNFKHQQNTAAATTTSLHVAPAAPPPVPGISDQVERWVWPTEFAHLTAKMLVEVGKKTFRLPKHAEFMDVWSGRNLESLRRECSPDRHVESHELLDGRGIWDYGDEPGVKAPVRRTLGSVPKEELSPKLLARMKQLETLESSIRKIEQYNVDARSCLDELGDDVIIELMALVQVGQSKQSTLPLRIALTQARRLGAEECRKSLPESLRQWLVLGRGIQRLDAIAVVRRCWPERYALKLKATLGVFEEIVALKAAIDALVRFFPGKTKEVIGEDGRLYRGAITGDPIGRAQAELYWALEEYARKLNPRARAEVVAVAWIGMGVEGSVTDLVDKIMRTTDYDPFYISTLDLRHDVPVGLMKLDERMAA